MLHLAAQALCRWCPLSSNVRRHQAVAECPITEGEPVSHLPIRLQPGADLRRSLEEQAAAGSGLSAFVVAGIGSLTNATIRLAAEQEEAQLSGPFEIISLSGTLSASGAHLHMSVANKEGQVVGGHVCYGNIIRTTAEVLLVVLEGWHLSRAPDPTTGYQELQVKRFGPGESAA